MKKLWIKIFFNKLVEAELAENERLIDDCIEYKNNNLPRFIYKYRSFSSQNVNSLKFNKFYLSKPQSFNDPFDCNSILTFDQYMLLILNYKDLKDKTGLWPEKRCQEIVKRLRKGESYKKIIEEQMSDYGFSKYEITNYYKNALRELENFYIDYNEDLKNSFKFTCFSSDVNNNLMWMHYAKEHVEIIITYTLCPIWCK